ncbi:MAG: DUF4349 domain-containing protein [Fibromonadales bacterium]|nr:DUF4349 domain-containing protein [Fibromonadales bacterium]
MRKRLNPDSHDSRIYRIFQVNPIILLIMVLTMAVSAQVTEQNFTFSVRTANVDSLFEKVIQVAESNGGYFTNYNDHSISLRMPVSQLQEFQRILGGLAEISDKTFSSTDKTAELERLTLQIESRQKLMNSYFDLVKNAPFAELQAVQRELVSLNSQIEGLKGQKQAIEKKAALSSIVIRTSTIAVPVARVSTRSPFVWINSTDLNKLREDF